MDSKLIHGDCLEVMRSMPENSIDTIVTDPPYGLLFMGKKWDYDVPSVEIFKEMLRVAKPGATMLCFAGSRTQHRMAVNIEDAGWILKDCIMWLYGSGFPKATDISKQLDKGIERTQGKLRTDGRGASPQKIDNHGVGDTGIGHADGSKQQYYETLPTTPEAQLWNGWKSHGLKPAYEPIIVAMKPNEGSYADNALKHGVSGLNIDGGRIPHKNEEDLKESTQKNRHADFNSNNGVRVPTKGIYHGDFRPPENYDGGTGRFPANVIVDEEAAQMLDEQSGTLKSGFMKQDTKRNQDGGYHGGFPQDRIGDRDTYGDSGGASRFFYCAKASKAERNAGCEDLEFQRHSDRKKDNGAGGDNPRNRTNIPKQNFHPTVKPLKLMEYFCILTKTPTGGTVLDPFMGSGTTGIACENTDRDFIGIEKDEEYYEIASMRLKNNAKSQQMALI